MKIVEGEGKEAVMGARGPAGVLGKAAHLERYIFTGAGTAENQAGKNDKLEGRKNITARNESIVTKNGTEIFFRTYTPADAETFTQLASNPDFTAIRTAAGDLTFMQAGAAKFYLHSAKGEKASVSHPIWASGKMAVGKKKDSFATPPGRQPMAKNASTVASYVQQGFLKVVDLPSGGKGYKVAAEGANGDKAWNTLRKAGFSFRQKVGDAEVWMNQATWQKMQRS